MLRKLAPSSIVKYLAGNYFFFLKLWGFKGVSDFFQVKQALKGYKKSNFLVDNRKPIIVVLLSSIFRVLPNICFSNFECLLFHTDIQS